MTMRNINKELKDKLIIFISDCYYQLELIQLNEKYKNKTSKNYINKLSRDIIIYFLFDYLKKNNISKQFICDYFHINQSNVYRTYNKINNYILNPNLIYDRKIYFLFLFKKFKLIYNEL